MVPILIGSICFVSFTSDIHYHILNYIRFITDLPYSCGRPFNPTSSGTKVTEPSSLTKHGIPTNPCRRTSLNAGCVSRSRINSFKIFTCALISRTSNLGLFNN